MHVCLGLVVVVQKGHFASAIGIVSVSFPVVAEVPLFVNSFQCTIYSVLTATQNSYCLLGPEQNSNESDRNTRLS